MNIRPALILSATACAALVAAPASSSYIEDTSRSVRVIGDPTFDIFQPSERNGLEEEYVPAADRTTGDITRFEVDHRRHRVRLTVSAQELARPAVDDTYELVFVGVSMETDADDYNVYVVLDNTSTKVRVLVGPRSSRPRSCPGKVGTFDEESDAVMMSVPRRCLGTPEWVRAMTFIGYSWPYGGDADFYSDSAPAQTIGGPERFTRRAWHPGS